MTQYIWQAGNTVRQLAVTGDPKAATAFLTLDSAASPQLYADVPKHLMQAGMECVPDVYQGQPALRIKGFASETELLELLRSSGVVKEAPTQELREDAPPKTFMDWVREHSIVAAGLTYLVADALTFASGRVRGDRSNEFTGMAFASTSVMLTLFGTPNPHRQMQNIYAKVKDYVDAEGIEIHEDDKTLLADLQGNPEAVGRRLANFVSDNLVMINNVGQGIGGAALFKAGNNQASPLKTMAGASVMVGQWGALGIKEDPTAAMSEEDKAAYNEAESKGETPDETVPYQPVDKHPMNYVEAYLKRKPLRLTGIGASLNNVLMLGSGGHELMKLHAGTASALQSPAGAYMDIGAQAFNLVANTLYGMSKKDRRGSLKEDGQLDEVYTVAASMFVDLPPQERSDKLHQFAGYMANIPDLKSSAQEIYDAVSAKIEHIEHNPWHIGMHHAEQLPETVTHTISYQHRVQPEPSVGAQL